MSEEHEYKYQMTCGHMSNDPQKCPYGCPDSKALIRMSDGAINPELKKEE